MNLAGWNFVELDLLTILTAYLFLYYGNGAVVGFAFGQGLIIDLFSGGTHGLFTFLYLVVCLGIFVGSKIFNIQRPKGQAVLIFLAVLFKKILFLALLTLFSFDIVFSKSFLLAAVLSAIITGLAGPFFFRIFDRL